jgi:peptidoglycan-associated lipoprotein
MIRKGFIILIVTICLSLIMSGCARKTALKEEPSVKSAEELQAIKEKERARLEAQEKAEEEAKRELAKKEFERSLVAKKTPGIAGEVFESEMIKDIHFDFDKYNIRPNDAEILKENSALLMKYTTMKFQIEGHCDERGTDEYNLALGERRANSTKNYLISLGIDASRISTISYGEENPLDPGKSEEAWSKNRRAHFVVLSK